MVTYIVIVAICMRLGGAKRWWVSRIRGQLGDNFYGNES